jgi:hypothetical protein
MVLLYIGLVVALSLLYILVFLFVLYGIGRAFR